jgi:hypothetical protein
MQRIDRYYLKPGKAEAYLGWLKKNDQVFRDHAPEGQTYLGTWFTVQGFGDYDVESRWELEDYAALGGGFGDHEFQAAMNEWDEYADTSRPQQSVLMKSEDDVRILEGN